MRARSELRCKEHEMGGLPSPFTLQPTVPEPTVLINALSWFMSKFWWEPDQWVCAAKAILYVVHMGTRPKAQIIGSVCAYAQVYLSLLGVHISECLISRFKLLMWQPWSTGFLDLTNTQHRRINVVATLRWCAVRLLVIWHNCWVVVARIVVVVVVVVVVKVVVVVVWWWW